MLAVLFAALAGALFGALAVAVRSGLRRGGDPEVGALVVAGVALLASALLATPSAVVEGVRPGDLWPFLLAGALVILVYLLVVRRSVLRSRLRTALPAFAVAGVSLGLAYVSLLEAFDRGRVSIVAPLNATQSLWAVVFSAVVVGRRSEVISRRLVLAGALVVAGSALIGAVR